MRLPIPEPGQDRPGQGRPGQLPRRATSLALAGGAGLCPLAGCAGGVVRAGSERGPFGPVAPPGGGSADGLPLELVLAGLVLGLLLGFVLGLAWPAWRRRRAGRAPAGPAKGLPGDLIRLRTALGLLEDLLLDWRGRRAESADQGEAAGRAARKGRAGDSTEDRAEDGTEDRRRQAAGQVSSQTSTKDKRGRRCPF